MFQVKQYQKIKLQKEHEELPSAVVDVIKHLNHYSYESAKAKKSSRHNPTQSEGNEMIGIAVRSIQKNLAAKFPNATDVTVEFIGNPKDPESIKITLLENGKNLAVDTKTPLELKREIENQTKIMSVGICEICKMTNELNLTFDDKKFPRLSSVLRDEMKEKMPPESKNKVEKIFTSLIGALKKPSYLTPLEEKGHEMLIKKRAMSGL